MSFIRHLPSSLILSYPASFLKECLHSPETILCFLLYFITLLFYLNFYIMTIIYFFLTNNLIIIVQITNEYFLIKSLAKPLNTEFTQNNNNCTNNFIKMFIINIF